MPNEPMQKTQKLPDLDLRRRLAEAADRLAELEAALQKNLLMVDGRVYDHRDVSQMLETVSKLPQTADSVPVVPENAAEHQQKENYGNT